MPNPPFVLPQGFTQIPPNYAYKKVGQMSFPLKADRATLKTLIDKCLNDNLDEGTEYSYTLFPTIKKSCECECKYWVYLIVSTYGSMVSSKKPFSDWGEMSQAEVMFTIPLLRLKKGGNDGIALYTPFCFVDNAWSVITGNMILGFQKGLASFEFQPRLCEPYPIKVKTSVFPIFGAKTRLSEERWIVIDKKEPAEKEPAVRARDPKILWPFGSVKDLYGLGDCMVKPAVLELICTAGKDRLVEVVQLLQLRDPAQPDFAAYSRIVKFAAQRQKEEGEGEGEGEQYQKRFLPPAQIELVDFDSLPVRETLGLESGLLISQHPFYIESDFNFVLPE